MNEKDQQVREDHALFANLVVMLSTSAMQQLGKIVNPMTRKAEVDLQGARMAIDMLAMLRDKTRGNLTAAENRMLQDVLASLQLNYVQTAGANPEGTPDRGAEPGSPSTGEPSESGEPSAEQPPAPDPGKESREPRYHKSYGG